MLRAVRSAARSKAIPAVRRRENWHQPGFPRRVVHWLCRRPGQVCGWATTIAAHEARYRRWIPAQPWRAYARGVAGSAGKTVAAATVCRDVSRLASSFLNWLKRKAETSAEDSDDRLIVNRSVPVQTVSSRFTDFGLRRTEGNKNSIIGPIQNTVQASGTTVPFKKLAATTPNCGKGHLQTLSIDAAAPAIWGTA